MGEHFHPAPPHSDVDYYSDPTIRYLGQVLLEEDVESHPFMYDNFAALRATEASFHNAINDHSTNNSAFLLNAMRQPYSHDPALLYSKALEEAGKFLPSPSTLSVTNKRKPQAQHPQDAPNRLPPAGRDPADAPFLFNQILLLPTPHRLDLAYPNRKDEPHKKNETTKHFFHLRTLLLACAQAMSCGDVRSATENLKQIRSHCSRDGDDMQRLSYYLATALEARLAGSTIGVQSFYKSLSEKATSASEMLKAVRSVMYGCPIKRFSMAYINEMILHFCADARTLHIIDFGILYGYQWPSLIQSLSSREGKASPKLRITGVELPQAGFRSTERIEETGRRLGKYCEKFGVEFEYNCLAERNWEKIRIEDLNLRKGELLVVNSLRRLKNLIDEAEEGECQRDQFLNMIRKMKPDMLCYSEANGGFSSPFFLTRFREVLFYYSAQFDVFETTLPRDHREREILEAEFCGMEAMNAVACEGAERMERPETYQQWQFRTSRAGFQMFPLKHSIVEKFRQKLRRHYHRDFAIEDDDHWLLQGWKGRILNCTSCWFSV